MNPFTTIKNLFRSKTPTSPISPVSDPIPSEEPCILEEPPVIVSIPEPSVPTLPTAAVFVDFENWYSSLSSRFHLRPQIKDFYERITKDYTVERLLFFGDFTRPALRDFLPEIRSITNEVIETQNGTERTIKDFTDFIMLDYIYQDVDQNPETSTYILFSGDGHFSSVASYLINKKQKKFVVYGIRDCLSGKLKAIAHKCVILPTTDQEQMRCKKMIIDNLDQIAASTRVRYPTFTSTARTVAAKNGIEEDKIRAALQELIREGVLECKVTKVGQRPITVLHTNWTKAGQAGLWEPDYI